ncbi:hypothetical protein ACU5DF_23890 [Aliivibrio wodanis]|uniref:hypothetical protein n=1 Tax=Aliivibrio wodanis TaxID=80852 RepID=UPI00406CF19D
MPYELRDFEDNQIGFTELNKKSFACKHGETQEELFVHTFNRLQNNGFITSTDILSIHPEKESNPYHPDLAVNHLHVGELKSKASPLFIARKYGIDPQYALTMDLKDSFHYSKFLDRGVDISIYIWVKWAAKSMSMYKDKGGQRNYTKRYDPVRQLAGIWKVKFSELRKFEKEHNAPIHWYHENFRHPPEYDTRSISEKDKKWVAELIKFEPRLSVNGVVKGIASKGYTMSNGELYSSGDSSGSYVFDLNNAIFQCLYSNGIYKRT